MFSGYNVYLQVFSPNNKYLIEKYNYLLSTISIINSILDINPIIIQELKKNIY